MKKRLLLALAASCPAAMAVDYTWTGAAADGDWNNQLNWTDIEGADGVPVDDNVANLQLTLNAADRIIFDGSTMPTENVPSINSGTYVPGATGNESTPTLVLNSGGSITFPSVGDIWTNDESGVDRTVFTIGDGIGGPGDVTLVSAGSNCFMRHADGTHRFQINSDGVFISNGGANRWSWNGTSRQAVFTIDGGSVDINGTLGNAGQFHAGAVVFSSVGGTFSADFNPTGVFPDLAAVQAELGPGKDFQSSDPLLVGLNAQDNGDGSFTVTAVLPPPPNYWTGNGGSVLGDGSNNFTVNQPADVLSEDTLASLIGASDKATFGDNYFFSNGSSPVATSTLTTVAGGVVIPTLEFINTGTDYSVGSADANGIAGTTNVNVFSTGALTLTGAHATTGNLGIAAGGTVNIGDGITDGSLTDAAIGNGGALTYNVLGAVTQTGALSGNGSLDKQGAGSLIVTANSGLSGATSVTAGTLTHQGNYGSGSVDIASGATFELNVSVFTNGPTSTFTGEGTILKTGFEQFRWPGSAATFALGSGSLIDVQEGIFRAGSNANENWTNNFSDLNVAFNGTFNTHEANVRVDAITGEGNIGSGFNGAGYTNFTIGVDNGSGTFSGVIYDQAAPLAPCNIVKVGNGTQVFDGPNSYTGNTTVEDGTLTLDSNSNTVFKPTANNTTNQIAGITDNTTGTVNMNGTIYIDLTGAAAGVGNTWTLVDPANLIAVNYDQSTFYVDSSIGFFDFPDGDGIWSLQDGIALWKFDENTGQLSYSVGADARLWTGVNGSTWDQDTTLNFMDNSPSDPLVQATFDTALLNNNSVGFSDNYFDSGSALPVGTSNVIIAAGGVTGGLVEFLNTSTAYTVTSSDEFGITGATNINVGSGSVTFVGDHSSTGTTTVNGGLTFDATSAPSSFAPIIAGTGGIEKVGTDVVTLTATNTYTGGTTITGGTLKVTGNSATNAVNIASGATFEIDYNNRWGAITTYSGDGTILKTGTAAANFFKGTFALGSGALIDVQEGTFIGSTGGSGGSEVWTNNMSDVFVALGARFHGAEGNIRLDALDGEGTFATGFNGAGYVNTTIGVDNGTGTFSGVLEDVDASLGHIGTIVKIGTGEQTFSGDVTIGGNVDVQDGTLTLDTTGSISFYPGANNVTNQVLASVNTGTPVLNLNGAINFDLSGADTTTGNVWTILNPLNFTGVNVGPTATVTSSQYGPFTETVVDQTFEQDAGGYLWIFDVATATLTVGPGTPVGYSVFQTDNFTQTEIDNGDADENVDFDLGGLDNGIEFVVGGDPKFGADDAALAPTLEATTGGYNFTFRRTDVSISDNPGVEYNSDLGTFAPAVDGTDGVIITVNDDFYGEGIDQVIVFLPDSLAVGGKLFARLTVTPDF